MSSFTSGFSLLFVAAVLVTQPVYSASEHDLTKLERTFWRCDYLATIHGVEKVDVHTCIAVTDELKRVKFGDDLEKMLEWWRANKPAQHAALDRADMALAAGASAETVEDPDSN